MTYHPPIEPYPRVSVTGTPYERGHAYGAAVPGRIAVSKQAYASLFDAITGWSWDRVIAESNAYVGVIEAYRPTLIDEMRGIADGAGLSFDDVLALNLRTEVMYRGYAESGAVPPGECTAVGLESKAGQATLLGQNFDWMTHCFETLVVLEVQRDDGPNFVTVVEAGLLSKMGFNDAGFGFLVNAVYTEHDIGRAAVPYHMLVRALHDCESVDEAVDLIRATDRASSLNFVLGDRSGRVVDVEAPAGLHAKAEVIESAQGRNLHTNHFVGSCFADTDLSLAAIPDSPRRLARIGDLLDATTPEEPRGPASMMDALSDHDNYPTSICCHTKPDAPLHQAFATIASMVFDLDHGVLTLADGQPCTAARRVLDYGELFAADREASR